MSNNNEPSNGGLTLKQAYERYVDPEKLKALDEARSAPGVGMRIVRYGSSEALAKRHAQFAYFETIKDFRDCFIRGELVAWGAEMTPTAPRKRIPAHAWPYLDPILSNDTLTAPKKRKIYGIRVHSKEQVDDWEKRAAKDPQTDPDVGTHVTANDIADHKSRKAPIYTRVAEVWDSLPQEVRSRAADHGGQMRIGKIIASHLPHLKPQSVEREFRRLLKNERDGKSGKNAE